MFFVKRLIHIFLVPFSDQPLDPSLVHAAHPRNKKFLPSSTFFQGDVSIA